MDGHFSSRKQRLLASLLLLSGSFAGFGLGQQVGHSHQQASRRAVSIQVANVAGAIGSRVVTAAPTVRTRSSAVVSPPHTSNTPKPSTAPRPPSSGNPSPSGAHGYDHGHGDGDGHGHEHGHGHKDDGHPKANHHKGDKDTRYPATGVRQQGDGQPAKAPQGDHTPGKR